MLRRSNLIIYSVIVISTIEIDSYMFQTVGAEGVCYLAEALNIPLYQSKIKHVAACCSLTYDVPPNDEVNYVIHHIRYT